MDNRVSLQGLDFISKFRILYEFIFDAGRPKIIPVVKGWSLRNWYRKKQNEALLHLFLLFHTTHVINQHNICLFTESKRVILLFLSSGLQLGDMH